MKEKIKCGGWNIVSGIYVCVCVCVCECVCVCTHMCACVSKISVSGN